MYSIAYIALLAINIPDWFPSEKVSEARAQKDNQVNAGYISNTGNVENGMGYPPNYENQNQNYQQYPNRRQ